MPIRIRLALAFAAATLVLFGVSGVLFERSFRHGVETSLDPGLRTQAASLRRQIRAATSAADAVDSIRALPNEDVVAQLLDTDGSVLETTSEAGRRPAIGRSIAQLAHDGAQFNNVRLGRERERFRVLAAPVSLSDQRIIVVGESLEQSDASVERVHKALLIGGGIVVVLAGIGAWLLAMAALRPVERMRRQAAEISGHDVDSRLQVPSTRDEIAALGTTMNQLLARLQRALARQRAFVADAGHELRTPVAVLRTELELAGSSQRTREELDEAIRYATEETKRIQRLAEELLFLARSDDQPRPDQLQQGLITGVVNRSVETFRPRAAERGVTIAVNEDPSALALLDIELLRRAIDNLLENALRFAPPRSTVTIQVERSGSEVTIAVIDEGPGFPPEFLPHAFERFRRADEGRSRAEGGTGLGLAIVLAIAHTHHGSAIVANRSEGGAVVTLRIPAE